MWAIFFQVDTGSILSTCVTSCSSRKKTSPKASLEWWPHPWPWRVSFFQLLSHVRLSAYRLLCPWNFPGRNPGVGFHFLLQGIFPNPGMEPVSPALLEDSLPSESQESFGKVFSENKQRWKPRRQLKEAAEGGPRLGRVCPPRRGSPSSLKVCCRLPERLRRHTTVNDPLDFLTP